MVRLSPRCVIDRRQDFVTREFFVDALANYFR